MAIFVVRPARPADLAALTGLLATLFSIEADFAFDEVRQRRGLRLLLDSPRGRLLVAESNGLVIGMCSGQLLISTAEGGPALLVEDVVVREEWRGQGVGRALLAGIGEWGEKNGATRLQLLADRNNTRALEFYKKLGWQGTALICLRQRGE